MAGLRPRTNPIGLARSARYWWERGVMDGIPIRAYLRTPPVRNPFVVSYGSVMEWGMGGERGNAGITEDRRITK